MARERLRCIYGRRVFIEADVTAEKTDAGIYIPEQGRTELNTGTVRYAGLALDGVDDGKPSSYKVGDRVMYYPGEATPVNVFGADLYRVFDDAILGSLEPIPE